jgi:hypothetical protein
VSINFVMGPNEVAPPLQRENSASMTW